MKKLTALLLCAVILLMPLSGCGPKDTGPLRVCLDLGLDGREMANAEYDFDALMKTVAQLGGAQEYEVEFVPTEGEERMGALTRLRAEMMSGSGPDLILTCYGWQEELLFPYPEKSARNGLFLNLDKYMEKSELTDWDQQVQPVMNAGRTEKGQFIIPLSYQFNMSCFKKEDVSHTPSKDITWGQMAESSDVIDKASLTYWGGPPQKLDGTGDCTVHSTLGKLADYDKEELLFTADQLKEHIHKNFELAAQADSGGFDDAPVYFQPLSGVDFNSRASNSSTDTIDESTPLTYIPLYSRDGGVTAAVRSYAVISAGSRHKDEAFLVLDYLMSLEVQQNGDFYNTCIAHWGTFGGFPMDSRLMSEEYPAQILSSGEWSLTKENFEGLCAVRDAITAVNFFDTVTAGVYELESQCYQIYEGFEQGDIDELIDETCRVLAMSIQES